jgi:hypothetical protein
MYGGNLLEPLVPLDISRCVAAADSRIYCYPMHETPELKKMALGIERLIPAERQQSAG